MKNLIKRLFGIDNANEDRFAEYFLKILSVQTEHPVPEKRELWIRDFFQTRNQFAHGKRNPLGKSKWTIKEHLLLAAFIFPLSMSILR